jgi:hypothetical protein
MGDNPEAAIPLRILLVVDPLDLGGAERHVTDLARTLHAKGHRVVVASACAHRRVPPHRATINGSLLDSMGADKCHRECALLVCRLNSDLS